MSRVFVINQPRPRGGVQPYDLSSAMQYGDLIFVFRADQSTPSADPEWATRHAREILRDVTPNDFLIWAGGDPMGAVVASAIFADNTDGRVNYLKWERERTSGGERTGRGYYIAVPVDVFED